MPEHSRDGSIERVRDWFARSTHAGPAPSAEEIVALKGERRVSVVLPARDEGATVGAIVHAVVAELQDATGLVDEVLVVDSRSTDDTAERAREAGAVVVTAHDPVAGFDAGKGAALRTGVDRMSGDVGVFLDADVREFGTDFVRGLLAPLLRDPELVLVKAFYDRPWNLPGEVPSGSSGGGRVTELVARPLIARRAPELAGFVQPLSGECAFVREAVLGQRFASGYAVDVAMLLQTVSEHGLDAVAQADLGRRLHRHQDLDALGRMALQVAAAFDLVLDDREVVEEIRTVLARDDAGRAALGTETVTTRLLPPTA